MGEKKVVRPLSDLKLSFRNQESDGRKPGANIRTVKGRIQVVKDRVRERPLFGTDEIASRSKPRQIDILGNTTRDALRMGAAGLDAKTLRQRNDLATMMLGSIARAEERGRLDLGSVVEMLTPERWLGLVELFKGEERATEHLAAVAKAIEAGVAARYGYIVSWRRTATLPQKQRQPEKIEGGWLQHLDVAPGLSMKLEPVGTNVTPLPRLGIGTGNGMAQIRVIGASHDDARSSLAKERWLPIYETTEDLARGNTVDIRTTFQRALARLARFFGG